MKKIHRAVCLLGVVLLAGLSAQASVIFDNGGPELSGGLYADLSVPQVIANDFSLDPGSNTITDVHWWGFYFPGSTAGPDDFTIQIFADASNQPEATPSVLDLHVGAVTVDNTGLFDASGYSVYEYSVDISPLTLSANTTYWLDIFNATSSTDASFWVWSLSDSSGGDHVWANYANGGFANLGYGQMAFNLTNDGVVPEPPTIVLMGLGLGGLAVWRARRALNVF